MGQASRRGTLKQRIAQAVEAVDEFITQNVDRKAETPPMVKNPKKVKKYHGLEPFSTFIIPETQPIKGWRKIAAKRVYAKLHRRVMANRRCA